MTVFHLITITITILLYLLLAISYFGWGRTIVYVLEVTDRALDIPITFYIFIGWACTLLVFQLIHFILPLTFNTVSPVFAIGLVFSWIVFAKLRKNGKTMLFTLDTKPKIILVILILLSSALIASLSMLSPINYDSGLYHFNAIRWINSFPIVPGLGNLHGRLAFNQSFFTYVSALNLHPFFGQGRSIANSFLLLLSALTLIEILFPLIRCPLLLHELCPTRWLPALLGLPVLAYWALSSNGLASPSPDLTSSLLQIIIFSLFVQSFNVSKREISFSSHNALTLSLLTTTAITIKLSNIMFSAIMMILVLFWSCKTSEKPFRDLVRLLLPAVLIVMVWCVRGIVLSGAPIYPSTIGYISTQWSIPMGKIIEDANLVYSWARQPKTPWREVLGNWNWFFPWLHVVARDYINIVYPVGVFLALGILNFVVILYYKVRSTEYIVLYCILPLPLFAGLVFWFVSAPDLRFANALFLLLPVSAALPHAIQVQKRVSRKTFLKIICLVVMVCNFNLLYWTYKNKWTHIHFSVDGWQDVKRVALNEKVTNSGLLVYTPVIGDQCWDAPLPCTPYFNENLRLIDPVNMSSGFTVVPLENIAGMPNPYKNLRQGVADAANERF